MGGRWQMHSLERCGYAFRIGLSSVHTNGSGRNVARLSSVIAFSVDQMRNEG
jgi:hypothetical protein